MFSSFDISTSALTAQRIRLNAISSNIANFTTTRNEAGESTPYQPRFAVFEADTSLGTTPGAAGVRVKTVKISDVEPLWRPNAAHPDAQKEGPHKGQVAYPNIDLTTEFVDALGATRAYEANIGVIEVTKDLGLQTLRILA